jgi:hypothetical protein
MVSPINGEKPLASSAERLGESTKNSRPEQRTGSPASSPENKPAEAADESPKLDQARQLYELENQTARPAGERITTPEAARSLLNQILEQISSTPEQAVKAQGAVSSPLANLLQAAPG